MKIIRKAAAFAIVVAVTAISALAIYRLTATQPNFQDVAYATESSRNTLDVYLSDTTAGPQPLIILVHGGGFKSGDKARPGHLDDFLASGFAVAAIN